MGKLFGTDGVRGIANTELTPELAFKLGRVGAYALCKNIRSPQIFVANDSRRSANMLEAALTAGLTSMGANVVMAGMLPTPAVAYIVRKNKFDAGVMVSASHNKFEDNGIKFFTSEGFKLPDKIEAEIEMLIEKLEKNEDSLPRPTGEDVGTLSTDFSAGREYLDFLLSIGNLRKPPLACEAPQETRGFRCVTEERSVKNKISSMICAEGMSKTVRKGGFRRFPA